MNNNTEKPQEQNQTKPAAPAWTEDQLKYLARLAWREIAHSPGFKALPPQAQTQRATQRLQEMTESDHYWNLACKQFPPTQPAAHNTQVVPAVRPAPRGESEHEPSETHQRQKEGEPFDHKSLIGMSPVQIMRELVKTGKVTDATNPGHGLEVFQTSQRTHTNMRARKKTAKKKPAAKRKAQTKNPKAFEPPKLGKSSKPKISNGFLTSTYYKGSLP